METKIIFSIKATEKHLLKRVLFQCCMSDAIERVGL